MKLTRREVAAKLGRSIATVRRLEGHVLHPHRDWQGIYRFDPDEVEQVVRQPHRAQKWARSPWLANRLQTAERRSPSSRQKGGRQRLQRTRPTRDLDRLFDAAENLITSARRGTFASRTELIVSLESFTGLLDAMAQQVTNMKSAP